MLLQKEVGEQTEIPMQIYQGALPIRTKQNWIISQIQIKSIEFSSFLRKVVELLMSNENVLLFLYEKLFPIQKAGGGNGLSM